jgi:chromosome segregation ATPase
MTDLKRENRRLRGELARAREDIADLQARLAYALQKIRELSTRIPRREPYSTQS